MPRNIVICSDGTGQNGQKESNVARIFAMLDLSDPRNQIACYAPGVGVVPDPTLTQTVARRDPGVVEIVPEKVPFGGHVAGLAVGYGVFKNVRQLYEVLIEHYDQGDRLYFFGFSRGAFTVRVLAGLIYRCGILRPEHRECFWQAFKLYDRHEEALEEPALEKLRNDVERFRTSFTRPCTEITFLGIWDTVKSVGYLRPQSLPHTRRNPLVRNVRHALALDERRSFYGFTTWGGLDGEDERVLRRPMVEWQPNLKGQKQDVQEVWFPGAHSDVGGGYAEEQGLAYRPLKWITAKALELRLRMDEERANKIFTPLSDAKCEVHDELRNGFGWRVTEFLPRWTLKNWPPPPKRDFEWSPAGKRVISQTLRDGVIHVDSSAPKYSRADLHGSIAGRVHFIDTV